MALNKALITSKRDSWNTPERVLELVRKVAGGRVGFDPCPNDGSIVDPIGLTQGRDGLDMDWTGCGLVYVNPPYGREIGKWVEKCDCEYLRAPLHTEIIALLPARPDARWFEHVWHANALCFWRGRLRFLGAPSSAPFPSVVAYWGPRKYRFADVFNEVGHVVFP